MFLIYGVFTNIKESFNVMGWVSQEQNVYKKKQKRIKKREFNEESKAETVIKLTTVFSGLQAATFFPTL